MGKCTLRKKSKPESDMRLRTERSDFSSGAAVMRLCAGVQILQTGIRDCGRACKKVIAYVPDESSDRRSQRNPGCSQRHRAAVQRESIRHLTAKKKQDSMAFCHAVLQDITTLYGCG